MITAPLVVETFEDEDFLEKEAPPKEPTPQPQEEEKEDEKTAIIPTAIVVATPVEEAEPDVADDVPQVPEEVTHQLQDSTVVEVHQVVEVEPQQVDRCVAEDERVTALLEEEEEEKPEEKQPEVVPEPEPTTKVEPDETPEPERGPTPDQEPVKETEPEVVQDEREPASKESAAETEKNEVDTRRSSMSSEDGFLEELNLIKNSRFTEQDRQPENWMQFGNNFNYKNELRFDKRWCILMEDFPVHDEITYCTSSFQKTGGIFALQELNEPSR